MLFRIVTDSLRAALLGLLLVSSTLVFAAEDTPSDKSPSGIYGRVFAQDKTTKALSLVPGAHIEIVSRSGKIFTAESNAQGFYSIDRLPSDAYTYRVKAAGYRDEDAGRGFDLQSSSGDAIVNFTLELGQNDPDAKPPEIPRVALGALRGQVYEKNETGPPTGLDGASVILRKVGGKEILKLSANAPTEGQSSSGYLRELEAGEWQITISAEGFTLPAPVVVNVASEGMAIQDFLLTKIPEPTPKNQGLTGVVTLANAEVSKAPPVRLTIFRLGERAGDPPISLDPKGSFKLDRPAGRYIVRAEAPGYLPKNSDVNEVLPGSFTVVNMQLERLPTKLLVKVLAADSKQPLGNATLMVRQPNQPLEKAARQITNAAGQALFDSVNAGDYQVMARISGFKSDGKTKLVKAGETNTLEMYLEPEKTPTTLTLQVLDLEKRDALSDATVQVTPFGKTQIDGVTDTKGIGEVKLESPAICRLTVSRPGYVSDERQVSLAAGENKLTVFLSSIASREPTLTLIVTCKKTREPLEDVSINVTPEFAADATKKTDTRGIWYSKLPQPGRYKLELKLEGYYNFSEELVSTASNITRRIELIPDTEPDPQAARLLVTVIQAGDAPVAAARVVLMPVNTESKSRFDGLTDAKGKAVSPALTPETYTFSVEKEGFDSVKGNFALVSGDNLKTITLTKSKTVIPVPDRPKTAELALTVVGGERLTPVSGAAIKIKLSGREVKSGSTGEDGMYKAELPGVGIYSVEVIGTGFEPNQTSVSVTEASASRKIQLKPISLTKRTINVLVREGGRKISVPIDGAEIKVFNSKDEVVAKGTTNALGRFPATNLEPGVYTIEAVKAGYTQRARSKSDITRSDDQPETPLYRNEEAQPKIIDKPKDDKSAALLQEMQSYLKEGYAAIDARDFPKAAAAINHAVNLAPQHPDVAAAMRDYRLAQDADIASRKKNEALRQKVQGLIQQGRIAIASKKWPEAAEAINSAAALVPQDKDVLQVEKEYQKAFDADRALAEALQKKKVDFQLQISKAKLLIAGFHFEEALAVLNIADSLLPGEPDTAMLRKLAEDGKRELAENTAKKEAAALQQQVQSLLQQGRKAIATKNWPTAANAINQALQLAPSDIDALKAMQEYQAAREAVRTAELEKAALQQQVQAFLKEGRAAIAAKNWQEAANAINGAANLAPTDAEVVKAEQEFQKAYASEREQAATQQRRQNEFQILLARANQLINGTYYDEALAELNKAEGLIPGDKNTAALRKLAEDGKRNLLEQANRQQQQAKQAEVQKQLTLARNAITAKNWPVAVNAINYASQLDPQDADVRQVVQEYQQAREAASRQPAFPTEEPTRPVIEQPNRPAIEQPPGKHVAIAYSSSTGRYGYSGVYANPNDAKAAAIKNCKAADAQVLISVSNGDWCALAIGDNGAYGYGFGHSAAEAKEQALNECAKNGTNASIVALVHAGDRVNEELR